jgi:hypothetical protein
MPADFDKLRAEQEVLAAMNETRAVLKHMERELVETQARAEQRLNHIRKVVGAFDVMLIEPQREKVAQLQKQKET